MPKKEVGLDGLVVDLGFRLRRSQVRAQPARDLLNRSVKIRLKFGKRSVTTRLRRGYSSVTVRLKFGYDAVTMRLRCGYDAATARLDFGKNRSVTEFSIQ